jgi:TonB family protein
MIVPLAGLIMVGFAQTKTIETKTVVKQQKASQAATAKAKQSNKQSKNPSQQTDSKKATTQNADEAQQQAGQDKQRANSVDEIVVVGYGAPQTNDQQTSKRSTEVFIVVEDMPKFANGHVQEFLAKNIRYPVEAQKNGIQGRVICQFIVETDGSISSVQVVRSVDPLLDAEACRVLYTMPKWIPGKQRGQIVRVKYTLPISFALK